MKPGEYLIDDGNIEANVGRETVTLVVTHRGDRPIQVGSHFHFYETNVGLDFDREAAKVMRLNIAAGLAVRFEPGEQKEVNLVAYAGNRIVYGHRALVNGELDGSTS